MLMGELEHNLEHIRAFRKLDDLRGFCHCNRVHQRKCFAAEF
jgi:hypothetical protein